MRVGIITITGMPAWGGAEIYLDRLNNFLNRNGHESHIYTAVPEIEGYDNGSGNYKRLVLPHIKEGIEKHGLKHGGGVIFQDFNNSLNILYCNRINPRKRLIEQNKIWVHN